VQPVSVLDLIRHFRSSRLQTPLPCVPAKRVAPLTARAHTFLNIAVSSYHMRSAQFLLPGGTSAWMQVTGPTTVSPGERRTKTFLIPMLREGFILCRE
jgi:hypothetical protein